MKRLLSGLALGGVALALAGPVTPAGSGPPTITDLVASSGGVFDQDASDYDILLTAVLTAGLDDELADTASMLTVFAPNDRAFVRLAQDLGLQDDSEERAWLFLVQALTSLGGGDPVPVLTDVLLYHVVPGALTTTDVLTSSSLATLQGGTIDVFFRRLGDEEPNLRDPRLTLPVNLTAANGVVHTIDRVLLPLDLP